MLEECTLYARYKEISIYRKEFVGGKDEKGIPLYYNKVLVYYKDYLIWKTYMGGEKLYSLPMKIRNCYPLIEKTLKYSFLYREREIPENFLEDFFNLMEEKECEIFDYFLKKGKAEKGDDIKTERKTETSLEDSPLENKEKKKKRRNRLKIG